MIEDEMISSFVSEENALLYDDGYGNQLYIYPLDTGEIYIKQNGSFGGIGTTFEGTYEKQYMNNLYLEKIFQIYF